MNTFLSDTVCCFKYHHGLLAVLLPYEDGTVANFIKYQAALGMTCLLAHLSLPCPCCRALLHKC